MVKVLALILIGFFITDGSWRLVVCEEAVVCEGKNSTISCSPGYTIYITYANYGRQDRMTCPDPRMRTKYCYASRSSDIIERSCDGRRSCSLFASNFVFGDPCIGTYKYIKVYYNCNATPNKRVVLCEGTRRRIKCPWGFLISINRASYGRQEKNTCLSRLIKTTSCFANQSSDIVKRKCHYKNSCLLQANNSVFGDPCRGTHKYLSVSYRCIDPEMKVVFICQGKQRFITCPSGKTIDIRFAKYGRNNGSVCPYSSIKIAHCYARKWTSKVAALCSGKRYCLLRPFNQTFGDPCAGAYKYFYFGYYCT